MSLLISNFWAEVTLIPNPLSQVEYASISILPNPVADPHLFSSIESMAVISQTDGYDNGDRLLQACCKVFFTHCKSNNIAVNTRQGFSVLFETNIPRQVGLAGSSAIISAFWKTLLKFYGVTDEQIPLPLQASLVLSVEQDELGISAGLQDRVIQAYGGLVFMDFGKQHVEQYGYGKYERVNMDNLPPLWLAYVANPKDSGKVHSSVRQRFANGEPAVSRVINDWKHRTFLAYSFLLWSQVVEAMRQFAQLTTDAKDALNNEDHKRFAELMSQNFNLRRAVYGDAALGQANLRMIQLASEYNCVAKFPGSGYAIVNMWKGDDPARRSQDLRELRWALEKKDLYMLRLNPRLASNKNR
jgi:glucuronokinase